MKLVLSTLVTTFGFQISHDICNWLGCELWLQLIQNHAWHQFQAFVPSPLKLLCFSIRIWADSLSSDRSSIQTCCFAQDSIQNMRFCSQVIFLLGDQWLIERLSEAMGAALVGNSFSPIPSKFSFQMKTKSDQLLPKIYKALKPSWLLNWVSITIVVACFPQASWSLPLAIAAN